MPACHQEIVPIYCTFPGLILIITIISFICFIVWLFFIRKPNKLVDHYHPEIPENEVSEGEIPQTEYDKVQKELLELGFKDFTFRSLVDYYKLDQELPFELIGVYDDNTFKVRVTILDNILLTFEFDINNVTFIQNEHRETIQIEFNEHELDQELPTDEYNKAKTMFNKIDWHYRSLDATNIIINLSAKTHEKIVA